MSRDMIKDRWSIDIAEFETHTKKDYSWKNEFYENFEVEFEKEKRILIFDSGRWYPGTILGIEEEVNEEDRPILKAKCGFRIFLKKDEASTKYDQE